MRRKRRWRNVIYLFAGLSAAYLVVCFILARSYLYPGARNTVGRPENMRDVPGMKAWATPGISQDLMKRDTVFVLVHGYGGTQDGWNPIAEALQTRGYQVVIPEMPGHDGRVGETCGFGLKEAQVVGETVSWIREEAKRPVKVVLVGVSMGGAASWIASETADVDGVVTEGAFAVFEEAMNHWFDRKAPGASFYLKPVVWMANGMTGIKPSDVVPVKSAAKWKGKPALVIQGTDDALIGMSHAQRLAEASGAELWTIDGARHARCYDAAPDAYVEKLAAFAEKL